MIHTGRIGAGNGMAVSLVMWCPALAALAACRLFGIDLGLSAQRVYLGSVELPRVVVRGL